MLPENFDAEQHLPLALKEYRWEANYFVHTIAYQLVFGHRDLTAGVNLKAAYLETPLARKLPALRDALDKAGVIWCDYHKIEGEKCFGYGLKHPYCQRPLVWVHNQSDRLANAISQQRGAERPSLTLRVHKDLADRLSWLDFDHERAVAYIDTLSLSCEQKNCYKAVADCLRDKDFRPSDCEYGRFHSAITRMPSCLRRFLSFKGRQLSCVDLKNSQPFLLNLLVSNYFNDNKKLSNLSLGFSRSNRSHGFFESLLSDMSSKEELSSSHPPLPSIPSQDVWKSLKGKNLKGLAKLPQDAQRYLELTTQGRLYETLSGLGQCDGEDRSQIKVQLFEDYLYARKHKGKINTLFKDNFPSVDKVVRHFKSKNSKYLPRLLQRYESTLFVNRIARDFIAAFPDRAIATVHDSLIVETALVPKASAIVEDNFLRIGLSPRLSQDHYEAPDSQKEALEPWAVESYQDDAETLLACLADS